MKTSITLMIVMCFALIGRQGLAATYTWTQGGVATTWTDPANWDANGVPPKTEAGAILVFSASTAGGIGANPSTDQITLGSLSWSTGFRWNIGNWDQNWPGIIVDTGDASAATATAANGATLEAYYDSWTLNSNLELSGTGKLIIQAYGTRWGVRGAGGFIVNSGCEIEFNGTHGTEDYLYTGGVTIRSGGVIDVNVSNGALGLGLVTIDEGGQLQLYNSALTNNVSIVVTSVGANPPTNSALMTGGGASLAFSGEFSFDASGTEPVIGNKWLISNATATYAAAFSINNFTETAAGIWKGRANGGYTYTFYESSGILECSAAPAGTMITIR